MEHSPAPVPPKKVPGAQGWHVVEPGADANWPGMQARQMSEPAVPAAEPMGQGVQEPAPAAENDPG